MSLLRHPLILLLLLTLLSCSCETDLATGELVTDEAEEVTTPVAPPGVETPTPAAARLVVNLVNDLRTKGCRCGNTNYGPTTPLTLDDRLMQAAANHSADMARQRRMQHEGSDGSTVGVRATRAGYTWRAVAENVAWNQTDAAAVVAAWKDSPGHCVNMMNPAYTHLGYANVNRYYTQVFAAPR